MKKNIIYVAIAIVAMICYGCEKNDSENAITYNTAIGEYYGDLYGAGTANFVLAIYNYSDENVGVVIDAFCELPSNFSNFKLNTGTYSIAKNKAENTFLAGKIDNEGNYNEGTVVYDFNSDKYITVTGGTFTVEYSEGKYTISTNFSGKDYITGDAVNNLKYNFTGAISFSNESNSSSNLSFSDIVKSNYSATGTPGFLLTPGPSSWTGQVTPSSGQSQFYEISGWGGKPISVYCDFKGGKIILDNYTKVAEETLYLGYFYAIAINTSTMKYNDVSNDYVVAYNKNTRTMDFSGTYQGLPVYVGVIVKNKSTGDIENAAYTELYANAKLVLSSGSKSSDGAQAKVMAFSYSSSVSSEEFKNYTRAESTEKRSVKSLQKFKK